jgi:hypothetical protein
MHCPTVRLSFGRRVCLAVRLAGLAVLATFGLAACVSRPVPSPSDQPVASGEVLLRSIPPSGLCAGGGTVGQVTLHGSPTDQRLPWLTLPDGTERQLSWSPGTRARFDPDLEVIGPSGKVIAHKGSLITGTCIISPDFLMAEFGP